MEPIPLGWATWRRGISRGKARSAIPGLWPCSDRGRCAGRLSVSRWRDWVPVLKATETRTGAGRRVESWTKVRTTLGSLQERAVDSGGLSADVEPEGRRADTGEVLMYLPLHGPLSDDPIRPRVHGVAHHGRVYRVESVYHWPNHLRAVCKLVPGVNAP